MKTSLTNSKANVFGVIWWNGAADQPKPTWIVEAQLTMISKEVCLISRGRSAGPGQQFLIYDTAENINTINLKHILVSFFLSLLV